MAAADTTADDPVLQYSPGERSAGCDAFKRDKKVSLFLMRDQVLDFARWQSVDLMLQEDYNGACRNDLVVDELLLAYSRQSGGWARNKEMSDLQVWLQVVREQKGACQERDERRLVALRAESSTTVACHQPPHPQSRTLFSSRASQSRTSGWRWGIF
jgi:hypothetical protein